MKSYTRPITNQHKTVALFQRSRDIHSTIRTKNLESYPHWSSLFNKIIGPVVEPKFKFMSQCTLKQTETPEFGAEVYYRAKKGAFISKLSEWLSEKSL